MKLAFFNALYCFAWVGSITYDKLVNDEDPSNGMIALGILLLLCYGYSVFMMGRRKYYGRRYGDMIS